MFDWFWRKLFGETQEIIIFGNPDETNGRKYHFELPYKIEAMYLHYGIQQLKDEGIFQKLPEDMQKKWQRSLDNWYPVRITKSDLDRIDDDSWEKIATKLGLKWSK